MYRSRYCVFACGSSLANDTRSGPSRSAMKSVAPEALALITSLGVQRKSYGTKARDPARIFEAAAEGRLSEAAELVTLFEADQHWGTLARLLIAWVAPPDKAAEARALAGEAAKACDRPHLLSALAWVRLAPDGVPEGLPQISGGPDLRYVSAILQRAGGAETLEGLEPLDFEAMTSGTDAVGLWRRRAAAGSRRNASPSAGRGTGRHAGRLAVDRPWTRSRDRRPAEARIRPAGASRPSTRPPASRAHARAARAWPRSTFARSRATRWSTSASSGNTPSSRQRARSARRKPRLTSTLRDGVIAADSVFLIERDSTQTGVFLQGPVERRVRALTESDLLEQHFAGLCTTDSRKTHARL